MTLYKVKNIDKLFDIAQKCKGNVNMVLPDGKINLKTDKNNVHGLLKGIMPESGYDLTIETEERADAVRLLEFAMQG